MTVKEFSAKYDVAYQIVYTSTYLIKPTSITSRNREYDEEDLRSAVREELGRRIVRHEMEIERAKVALRKVM